jgi:hypothetical protein
MSKQASSDAAQNIEPLASSTTARLTLKSARNRSWILWICLGLSPVLLLYHLIAQRELFELQSQVHKLETEADLLQRVIEDKKTVAADIERAGRNARANQMRFKRHLSQCRMAADIPVMASEFIISETFIVSDESNSGMNDNGVNFIVPEGQHRLVMKATDVLDNMVLQIRTFEFDLLPNSGYHLNIKSNAYTKDPIPLQIQLTSNHPQFTPQYQTVDVSAEQMALYITSSSGTEFSFPSEVTDTTASLKAPPSVDLIRNISYLATDESKLVVNISACIISDAPPCLNPYLAKVYDARGESFPVPQEPIATLRYDRFGRFLLTEQSGHAESLGRGQAGVEQELQ